MVRHDSLGATPFQMARRLQQLISSDTIKLGGNRKLKIYGMLDCKSGKRMHPKNRVFFGSEQEAKSSGYRPCGHCMPLKYKSWKTIDEQACLY